MQNLLERLGWSQVYFASLMGVHPKTVSRWCKGRGGNEAMKYLELVVRFLGV